MLFISLKFISLSKFLLPLLGIGRNGTGDTFFAQILVVTDVRTGEPAALDKENSYAQKSDCQYKKPCGKK